MQFTHLSQSKSLKKAPITAAQYSVKEAVAVNEKAEPTFDNLKKEWDANKYTEHFGDFDKVAEFAKDKIRHCSS